MNKFLAIAFFNLTTALSNPPANIDNFYDLTTRERSFDTVPKFVVDDYPLTYDMIHQHAYSRKSGELADIEGAWFSNDTLQQTLVFVLYTDGHRLYTFHFLNSDIPPGLINRMELHSGGEIASNELKQRNFKGFLTQTTKINKSYFKTGKGFILGDNKQKALKIYGKPTTINTENAIERFEWEFGGDAFEDGKTDQKGIQVAANSFGHQATMFFRNNKLIGLIFHNDIP
ncbi:MAG TPA: hypothetical protein VFP97_16305 [Chitinophagaceae bacterium]|nr:hypothetical protein [Chitinophagaceae bacterium]